MHRITFPMGPCHMLGGLKRRKVSTPWAVFSSRDSGPFISISSRPGSTIRSWPAAGFLTSSDNWFRPGRSEKKLLRTFLQFVGTEGIIICAPSVLYSYKRGNITSRLSSVRWVIWLSGCYLLKKDEEGKKKNSRILKIRIIEHITFWWRWNIK